MCFLNFPDLLQMSGVELDLPSLHEVMKHHGGMQNVIDKNKWSKVMEALKIPKVVSNEELLNYFNDFFSKIFYSILAFP